MGKSRVFIMGIDGGSWNIINPLVEEGKLPNLSRLMDESAWATLHSTHPPLTCPAWFTFSTGIKPARLGIYGFRGIPRGSNRFVFHTYKELDDPEFWDYLMQEGMSCGIINNPLVYPLKKHRGYIVPGFITPQKDVKTYPAGLMDELNEVTGGYELDRDGVFVIDDQALLEGCLRMADKRASAISYLLREYPADLFLGVFTATDRVCHRFMNRAFLGDGEEKEAAWQALGEVYSRVDAAIGRLLEIAEDDDFVVVMSDHGFAARPWNLHINQFLKNEGLLSLGVAGAMDRFGLTQRNVYRLLSRLHLEQRVGGLAPAWMKRLIPTGESRFGQFFVHELIEAGKLDWRHTRAVCLGNGIYLNTEDRPHGIVPNRDAEKLKARIREGLAELRDPDGNSGGIIALDPHELYGDRELKNAPDLMLEGEDGWEVSDSLPGSEEVFTACSYAGHSEQGIFMLRHPWAKVGQASEALQMEDLAPTILHLCGLPVPDQMDGKVRLDVFAPHTPLQREVARYAAEPSRERSEEERIISRVAELKRRGSI